MTTKMPLQDPEAPYGFRFAVDTGGTFTDLVIDNGQRLLMFKTLTTPHDPVEGVVNVLELAAEALGLPRSELLARGRSFVYGTTRATNALVTGSTARTAFLTTEGHPDVLVFREGGRGDPFDFSVRYPDPFVPRALTFEVPGRIASDGSIVKPLDEEAICSVVEELRAAQAEAVGVCLLWAIVNPAHEIRVGELLRAHLPDVPFTLSHALNPTLREYRRASATCIDASLKPLMTEHLSSLTIRLSEAGFTGPLSVVSSQGGAMSAEDVARAPVHSINSGPAMAPVAGRYYSRSEGAAESVIVVDTGGTTFDVSLVRDGRIPSTRETWIGPMYQGHITGFPSVDVKSVGAGGGSIAWVDDAGLLHVGPGSAGSVPGPACYGRGGSHATVTDACVALGYIDPEFFLGGSMALDVTAAYEALKSAVGVPLGMGVEDAAAAVLRIATENMVHAIEDITVQQGIDPSRSVMVGGGGAAGLNIITIAARLGCRSVLIPETGAALSAAGGLLTEMTMETAITHVTSTQDFDPSGVAAVIEELDSRCQAFLASAPSSASRAIDHSFEGRYPRQNWEIEVPLNFTGVRNGPSATAVAAAFHKEHDVLFGICDPASPIEIVTWRARARWREEIHDSRRVMPSTDEPRFAPSRQIWIDGEGWVEASVVSFNGLADGEGFTGPAIVESSFATIVIPWALQVRRSLGGHLVVSMGDA